MYRHHFCALAVCHEATDLACMLCPAHTSASCPSASDAAMLTTTKTVLSAPLPRVFEESANGKAVPVATPAHGPIGGGFQQDELGRISKETVSATQHALYPCPAVLGATP